ncbi:MULTISPECIES: SDR family oxidoreductase [Alteromonadaceae]|uniref:SDR family oxidoreductase n=1 Tax=Alteromonadaceae TaxID=72275 RepID=UPI0031098F61
MISINKVALITGASRGIGASIARRLANDGFAIVVNYVGSENAARNVVTQITEAGGRAIAHQADVSDAASVSSMFDQVESTLGNVEVLVNNAGIMDLQPLAKADAQHVDRQIDINLKGTINTLREASVRLNHGGSVINFSTSVVGLKLENYGVYTATKSAVETLTAIMAKEMRGKDIRVNAVAPGPTATELFLNGKSDELTDRMAKISPLGRLGTPDDIASVVSFLASTDGGWVNGQVIRANGGVI